MENSTQQMAEKLRAQRLLELRALFSKYSVALADEVLPETVQEDENNSEKNSGLIREEFAAITLQKHIRGYLARKHYVEILYEKYLESEREREKWKQIQVEEGLFLVQRAQMEEEIRFRKSKMTNQSVQMYYSAFIIQRWWRKHLMQKNCKHEQLQQLQDSSLLIDNTDTFIAQSQSPKSPSDVTGEGDLTYGDGILTDDALSELLSMDDSQLGDAELTILESKLSLLVRHKSQQLASASSAKKELMDEHSVLDQLIRNLIRKIV